MIWAMAALAGPGVKAELHSLTFFDGAVHSSPPEGEIYIGAVLTLTGLTDAVVLRQLELYDRRLDEPAGNPQYVCLDESNGVIECGGTVQKIRAVWSAPEAIAKAGIYLDGKKLVKRQRIE